jgi:hypothetical protein
MLCIYRLNPDIIARRRHMYIHLSSLIDAPRSLQVPHAQQSFHGRALTADTYYVALFMQLHQLR